MQTLTPSTLPLHKPMEVPKPSQTWKDRLAALKKAGLPRQESACEFEMRCWQAEQMGYEQITIAAAVERLMGAPHTNATETTTKHSYDWIINHRYERSVATATSRDHRFNVRQYWRRPKLLRPFRNDSWRVQLGALDELKRAIPYGVCLKMEECKQTLLFNTFYALAPMQAWRERVVVDPIILASIMELPPAVNRPINEGGQEAFFFLAQW